MRSLPKVTRVITLLSFLITLSYVQSYAQNTAPVPTTFEILSPPYGAFPFLINHNYGVADPTTENNRIFFGGDFASEAGDARFLGLDDVGAPLGNAGNNDLSRLTLGGTRQYDDDDPTNAIVVSLPGNWTDSFDPDDLGSGAQTVLDYTGENGFIAINEGDSLVIRLTGYVDPNNRMDYGDLNADNSFSGAILKSRAFAFDLANPANDGMNGVRFGVVPSSLPDGATFSTAGLFSWVPNFLQGDGATDNSYRGGRLFIDANISDGDVASETETDTSSAAHVGRGLGELKDSLYVVLFTATDDGIPPMTGMDSLFVMVNDSLENPEPIFTRREVLNRQGQLLTYDAQPDSMLRFSEGDSIVVTFYAKDMNMDQGGDSNDDLVFDLPDWSDFIRRPASGIDSLALDTVSILTNGTPSAFRVRLKLAYNVAEDPTVPHNLVVTVYDGTSTVRDSIPFSIANVNRAPIWDADTTSKPSDSTLTYVFDPAATEPGKIQAFLPFPVANAQVDTINFSQYVYDPDMQIADPLDPGPGSLTFSQSGSPSGAIFEGSGLMILNLTSPDTTSYPFTISATDGNATNKRTGSKALVLRVAPQPAVAEIYPHMAYPGQDITIFGSGFGLYDEQSDTPSKVVFRARNSQGVAQNLEAVINSWSRDRINVTVPPNTPVSVFDPIAGEFSLDTIMVSSAVFGTPTVYPYVIGNFDSTRVDQFELANLTSTSVRIKWKTPFTGTDSVVLAYVTDTLSFADGVLPVFKVIGSGVNSTVHRFTGTTSTTDQIHDVLVTNLVPSTTYRFFVGMSNGLFFGDASGTLNGPYQPTKIDVNTAANNAGIAGFKFRTPPSAGSSGESYVINGKAFSKNGAAVNAIVTVKVIDYQSVADTSTALVATVKTDSTWLINLAGALKTDATASDRIFRHKQGDYLLITVEGGSGVGFQQFVVTRGSDSPQEVSITENGISLAPSVAYDLRLRSGLNLVGVPVKLFVTEPKTAEALLNRITGGLPSITRYVSATGMQETISKSMASGGRGFIGANNFDLALFESYFIKSDQEQYVTFNGSLFGEQLDPVIFPNAGFYWISRPAQQSDLFYAWSARTMLANIDNASQLFRFEEDTQQYESAIIDMNGNFVANSNFHIDVSEGYILEVTAASQWDINTPNSVLLATADARFNKLTENTPSLTLNTSKAAEVPAGSATLRNLSLTDVTSAAARVSWMTDVRGTVAVRYGKVGEAMNMTALFDEKVLDGGMRMVQLLNLKPETMYNYEIVVNGVTHNDNGQPFTFTSAQVGIGLPYAVYGRLLDERGNALAKAIVYVEVRDGEDLSAPLMAITNEDGYWNVNLANLKTSGEGMVFPWNAGNEIRVNAVYQNASVAFRSLVSGQSPQNVVKATDLDGMAASQQEAARVTLPKAFALGQNYPNPFNPSTTLTFDIPDEKVQGVHVELKVYNIRGQLVRTLVDEVKQPGHFVVQWNGRNEKGEIASSGVYFYRIKAGDFVTTRKMVLLK